MKFTFNIQVTNETDQLLKSRLEFEPRDYSHVDISESLAKKIYKDLDLYSGQTSDWIKTEVETKGIDEQNFRSDILFGGASIDLNIEKPFKIFATFPFRVNSTGNQYAFIRIRSENSITATFSETPQEDLGARPENAWTRKY